MRGLAVLLVLMYDWQAWLPGICLAAFACTAGADLLRNVTKSESFGAYSIGHTLLGISFASLIALLATCSPESVLSRLFSISPLTVLGKYSDAIYIVHRLAYAMVQKWVPMSQDTALGAWGIFLCTISVSLGLALCSWKLIEERCLGLKRYAPRPEMSPHSHSPRTSYRLPQGEPARAPT